MWLRLAMTLLAPADPDPVSADARTPVEEREVVVVTGTQTERNADDSPVAVDVVDREEIDESGARDVAEILEEQPGLRVTRGFAGAGVRMMGLDEKYTVILVDGQRVTGLVNGQVDLRRLNLDGIEQIEIVRGGGSVLYGSDAVAGVINIRTRGNAERRQLVEADGMVSYGSFNNVESSARVGVGQRRWHLAARGGYRHRDSFDRTPAEASTTGDALGQWHVGLAGGIGRFGPFRVDTDIEYSQRDRNGIDANATGAIIDRRNLTETLQARVTPEVSGPGGRLRLIASYSLFRDQFVQDQRGDTALDARQETGDHVGQLRAQYDLPVNKHTLTVGSETQLEVLTGARLDPRKVDRQRFALYVQDEWVPLDGAVLVSVLPGVRVDLDTYFDAWVTPRLATLVRPHEKFDLRFSYGRSYRAPAFKEMFLSFDNLGAGYVVRGNPELQPEDAWGTTLDANYRPTDWLTLKAGAFETRLSNAIVTDLVGEAAMGAPQQFGYVNVGNAWTRGLDLRAALSFGRWVGVDGSYQLLATRDVDEDRPLPGRATHSGTFGVQFERPHPRWATRASIRGAAFGERSFRRDTDGDGDTEADPAPPFATVDLRVGQDLTEYLEVFVGVDNVLDAGDAATNPLVPRTFYGGLRGRY